MTDNERYLLRAEVDAVSETVRACEYATNNAISPLGAEQNEYFWAEPNRLEWFKFRLFCGMLIGMGAEIQESATARMGRDPAMSVLNAGNQCREVVNLFVTDSSCIVSNARYGPTLTTLSVTGRACACIAWEYAGTADIRNAT